MLGLLLIKLPLKISMCGFTRGGGLYICKVVLVCLCAEQVQCSKQGAEQYTSLVISLSLSLSIIGLFDSRRAHLYRDFWCDLEPLKLYKAATVYSYYLQNPLAWTLSDTLLF